MPESIDPPVAYPVRGAEQQHVSDIRQLTSNYSTLPARYSLRAYTRMRKGQQPTDTRHEVLCVLPILFLIANAYKTTEIPYWRTNHTQCMSTAQYFLQFPKHFPIPINLISWKNKV